MKKSSKLFSTILVFATATMTLFAAQSYNLIINGEKVNQKVIVQDGVTYVPLRTISEKLVASVDIADGNIVVNNDNTTSQSNSIKITKNTTTSEPSIPEAKPTPPPTNPNEIVILPSEVENRLYKFFDGCMKDRSTRVDDTYEIHLVETTTSDRCKMEGTFRRANGEVTTYKAYLDIYSPYDFRRYLDGLPIEKDRTWGGTMGEQKIEATWDLSVVGKNKGN